MLQVGNQSILPIVVSRGLVPEDFWLICKQQLKWAEASMKCFWSSRLFSKLSFGKITTLGTLLFRTDLAHLFGYSFYMLLVWTTSSSDVFFIEFLYGFPVLFFSSWIYHVQRWLTHASLRTWGFHWRNGDEIRLLAYLSYGVHVVQCQ
jgi:hypothetical protein